MIKRAILLLICLFLTVPGHGREEYAIGEVAIEGNQRVKTQTVLDAINLEAGQVVTPAQIDAAMQSIYGLDRFSDVIAEIIERNGIKVLNFKLQERPLVRRIRFEGNDELKTDKLRQAVTLRVPGLYDPREISKSIDAIKLEYIKEGYYAAEVTADKHVVPNNEALVTFQIDEGQLVRIKQIEFIGNTVFERDELMNFM
ncbi:MAG TPA: POTRA domain-containing protein, partial [Tichowtungia sp.]|nr:POTRA domain-containing protein [Tichowtungia sp.]